MHEEFIATVWAYYNAHKREMPWRDEPTFYNVLVSEIMLQQTQVDRVRMKYDAFMRAFPTIEHLARAPLSEVIKQWQGLGYNRRAKYLHEAAKKVLELGVPNTFNQLVELPGIGKNTAGAIMNYVYNSPTPFIETNIRTVYFHHFFADDFAVSDKALLEVVKSTIDSEHSREWFWALIDYGAWLKSTGQGRLTVSKHYKKQSSFKGSLREMRGMIVRELSVTKGTPESTLESAFTNDARYHKALDGLVRDGLVERAAGTVRLTD